MMYLFSETTTHAAVKSFPQIIIGKFMVKISATIISQYRLYPPVQDALIAFILSHPTIIGNMLLLPGLTSSQESTMYDILEGLNVNRFFTSTTP